MAKLTLAVPSVGEKNTTAEPKVDTALKRVEEWANGEVGTENIGAGTVTETMLATALVEKFTNRKGLAVLKPAGSETAVSENLYQMKNGATLTLPSPTINRVVGAFCLEASCKVKTPSGVIKGDFFSGATATLTEGQHLLLLADGTNYIIESGEPKREQVYKEKSFSKVEAEAGVEPSASRDAVVSIFSASETQAVTVGGIIVGGTSLGGFQFRVPAGTKWKTTLFVTTSTLLL